MIFLFIYFLNQEKKKHSVLASISFGHLYQCFKAIIMFQLHMFKIWQWLTLIALITCWGVLESLAVRGFFSQWNNWSSKELGVLFWIFLKTFLTTLLFWDPHLEYCIRLWGPQQKKDLDPLHVHLLDVPQHNSYNQIIKI